MPQTIPRLHRLARLPRQLLRMSPFAGDIRPTRVRLVSPRSGRPSLPFPHPWNYHQPLRILDTYFEGADAEQGPGRHNRYLDVPGFAPVLVTRDPRLIRAIATETGDRPGQFDRDTLPSVGIARATGRGTQSLMEYIEPPVRVRLEPEIKCVMLEMLTNNFFGAQIPFEEIRNRYVPALDHVIDHSARHGPQQDRHPDTAAGELQPTDRQDEEGLRCL